MRSYFFADQARIDLFELIDKLEEENAPYLVKVIDEIIRVVDLATEQPGIGRPCPDYDGARELIIFRRYLLPYLVHDDGSLEVRIPRDRGR